MKRVISTVTFVLCFHLSYSQISDSTKVSQINTTVSVDLNDTSIYTDVDTAASFPGGRPAWIKYLEKNSDPSVGVMNGAKFGKYNVIIRFVVMKDGTLKNFQPETKYGHGMEEEVIRVLKLSPNWIPAKKNNVKVNSIARQNLMFIIEKG
jgi:protein TonB